MWWSGAVLSGLLGLFLLWDGGMKVIKHPMVVKATVGAGFPENTIVPIGIALVVSVILYAIPRTAVLGCVLLTGYLGGAVATDVRLNEQAGLWSAIVFGILVWLGLWLREPRLRNLLPLR